jgi:hypothetical protein
VTSIIRDPSPEQDIPDVSATPLVLSLEDFPAADFSNVFKGYIKKRGMISYTFPQGKW